MGWPCAREVMIGSKISFQPSHAMRGLAPHWTFQTVEWSRKLASVHLEVCCATHFVLPDLPGVISDDLQKDFYEATTPPARIITLVASRHTPTTLEQWIQEHSHESDTFLVVGGNAKNCASLSSIEAIKTAKRVTPPATQIWAVVNPNDKTSIDSVMNKLEAGASGIITQPLLVSHAMETLDSYPKQDGISYLAGLALPKTQNSLYFWLNLLEQPELKDDALFRDHVEYFTFPGESSLAWAQEQLSTLATADIHGVHYMPVNNTKDLLFLLGDDNEAKQ